MKMKKMTGWVALLLLLLAARAQAVSFEFSQPQWTYPVPLSVLEDEQDVLRLINRDNLLDKDYPDQRIPMYEMVPVTAPVSDDNLKIRPVVNDALVAMLQAALDDGIKLYVDSAYRTYRTQEVQHYNRVKRMGRDDGIVQMAGASEHQAGLAADVVSWQYREGYLKEFGKTPEGQWLAENCARFGFIIRYPQDKMDITGVDYEPWHVRYVGPEAAAYIMETGLTLEAFTEEWQAAVAAYTQALAKE